MPRRGLEPISKSGRPWWEELWGDDEKTVRRHRRQFWTWFIIGFIVMFCVAFFGG